MTQLVSKWAKRLVLGVALVGLSACGNKDDTRRTVTALKELASAATASLSKGDSVAAATPDPNAMIANALKAIPDVPLYFMQLENTGAFAISSIYGVNGRHVTWVSPDRQTMTLENGMLVATRGFSSDLMSVEDGGASRLISQRRSGRVEKTYRFLNREDVTNRLIMSCDIQAGRTEGIRVGQVQAQTRVMTEHCRSDVGFEFTNTYWIDSSGRMVRSSQWLSAAMGKLVFQRIRY